MQTLGGGAPAAADRKLTGTPGVRAELGSEETTGRLTSKCFRSRPAAAPSGLSGHIPQAMDGAWALTAWLTGGPAEGTLLAAWLT